MLRRIFGIMAAALLLSPLVATADGGQLPFSDLTVTEPDTHFSSTQGCVAPEPEIRRNHMEYILHQRDETMHKGVRTRQFALEECINCHAVKDESGKHVRVEDARHFCASCHTYASVNIDCFQCHADVPVRSSTMQKPQSGKAPHHTKDQVAGKLSGEMLEILASEGSPNE